MDIVRAAEGVERMFIKRQGSSSSAASSTTNKATSSTSSAASSGKTSATATNSNSKSGTSGSNTASITSSSAPTGGSSNSNSSAATTSYDPRDPPGGVSMINPNPTSGAQYYKVGDWVTFAWNYTSLQATPTAIDVLASCNAAQQTYTIALNQTVGDTNTVLWDTGSYQQTAAAGLLTNTYTLIIFDADAAGGETATPRAGYLSPQSTFTFGMYTGQAYTPWSSYNCATCNGAMSSMERQTWISLLAMACITVASFTWFATGVFGVL